MMENEFLINIDDVINWNDVRRNQPLILNDLGADTAVKALKEYKQYHALGTVEECRAAVEKQRAIKPTFEMNYGDFESLFSCECGKKIIVRHNRGVMDNHNGPNFCSNCGKKWDWSDSP